MDVAEIAALLTKRAECIQESNRGLAEVDRLDQRIDRLYRDLDAANGVPYVPRFRNRERASSEKMDALAEAVRVALRRAHRVTFSLSAPGRSRR